VLDQATGRRACLRSNNNKIEKTIYGHALIDGAPATFAFRSTAYPIGRNQANLASCLKVKIDDEDIRVVGAKWRVTSRLESNNLGRWFVPQIDLIGKFGSPNGPTLVEARAAKAFRIALKTGTEPPVLAPKTPPPAQIPRGSTTFTTGTHASSEPTPVYGERDPPPIDTIDDDIPF
jgi:hypothetical protein